MNRMKNINVAGRLTSGVEKVALGESGFKVQYTPEEKLPVIVTNSFPLLGQLVAMRFIEWVQANPGGVVSLPTGKTPEHFIKWVEHLLQTWDSRETVSLLEKWTIDPAKKPDLGSLHFVQIDEFYPIAPTQHNSFYHYVNKYYMGSFGLDSRKGLFIDCSKIGLRKGQTLESAWPGMTVDLTLRSRRPECAREAAQKDMIRRIDDWCRDYEARITALGGIGFFLGGIGPDGHIGFNCRGSSHDSITRLTGTNYETQAAAATDLGGIEISRHRLVITIGLKTITRNRACTALIMAAGEAKAGVVANGVCREPDPDYPATVLHKLENSRFYITLGAAKNLVNRQLELIRRVPKLSREQVEKIVVDLSVSTGRPIAELTKRDFLADRFGRLLMEKKAGRVEVLKRRVRASLIGKIEYGCRALTGRRLFHTEPHHDDLLLGCLPAIVRKAADSSNTHFFATMTSGFNAVTNDFMKERLGWLLERLEAGVFTAGIRSGRFSPGGEADRDEDIWLYLDGVAERNADKQQRAVSRRLLRNLMASGRIKGMAAVKKAILGLLKYLSDSYPGQKDPPEIQLIKGMCREWEAECLWGYFGWKSRDVRHLRLAFYKGDIFTEEPEVNRDVPPILAIMKKLRPDVVSVAFDPEASGPDTHYKVMQAIHAAVDQYAGGLPAGKAPRIWGYRNVWYHFHPSESNLFIPVSMDMLSLMNHAFMNTFSSQEKASFPSHEYDGPFCELAQRFQVQKYEMLRTCLGREWFLNHPDAAVRSAHGFVFMKEMEMKEFFGHSRALRKLAEDK